MERSIISQKTIHDDEKSISYQEPKRDVSKKKTYYLIKSQYFIYYVSYFLQIGTIL